MKSSVLYFILIMAVLVGCTNDNEPVLDQVINQNEVNINQLKQIAASSGWRVSPKVEMGDRITPLTEGEIKNFQEDLQEYSVYPKMQEEREVEVIPIGDQYIFMLPFTPKLLTKSYSGGSVIVYATYGECFLNVCNQVEIKVCYDLDEYGNIVYAFAGSESLISAGSTFCPYGTIRYTTAYYECSWGSDTVSLKLWLNRTRYDNSFSDKEHFMVTGSVNIKTGTANLESKYVGKGLWSPIITTQK
ncbi:hypothetical protein [Parabacteroides faecis]|uniref:DUF4827 domain-containing protein n=1 Tax=Parabacteroides faecis TaxID=1217282 RepID=A0ABR6KIE0_9BACT|nr:hypothetical protein [Parabacteroides faecis]MBB4620667.1 hypothetical protein [Parabacteroides faecis]